MDAFLERVRSQGVGDAELMEHPFRRMLRGYDPEQVDRYLDELAQRRPAGDAALLRRTSRWCVPSAE